MAFVTIARNWLSAPPARPARARRRLGLTPLEDRVTPATPVVVDRSADFLAGNGTSQILGTSQDGRYVIFSSTSTNLVQNQTDPAGTKDLYWADLSRGVVKLVTELPSLVPGTNQYAFNTGQTYFQGAGLTGTDAFQQAVISADGRFVAFSSKVDASRLDGNYLTSAQFSGSTRTVAADRGNNTLDVFRWDSNTTVNAVQLVSRTYDDPTNGRPSEAVGRTGADSTDPSISSDGSFVGFVTTRLAGELLPYLDTNFTGGKTLATNGNNAGGLNLVYKNLVQDAGATPDVFVTDMNGTDSGGFFDPTGAGNNVTFRTKPLSTFGGDNFSYTFQTVSVVNNVSTTIFSTSDAPLFATAGALGQGVTVDPLGRYLGGDGLTAVFLSNVNPAFLSDNNSKNGLFIGSPTNRLTYQSTASGGTGNGPARNDVFWTRVSPSAGLSVDTRLASSTKGTTSGSVVSLVASGGGAEAAILAQDNSDVVTFTAQTQGAAVVTNGPTNTAQQELYQRQMTSELGTPGVLVSSQSGAGSVIGGGVLQLRSDGTVDPNGFSESGDGQQVAFASTSPAQILVPANKSFGQLTQVNDGNNTGAVTNKYDVFVKDTLTGQTKAVSVRPAPTSTAVPQTTGSSPANSPRISSSGRYVGFESAGVDYITGLAKGNAGVNGFVRDLSNATTLLLDQSTTGLRTANAGIQTAALTAVGSRVIASGGIFVGGNLSFAQAVFASAGSDIDPNFTDPTNNTKVYALDLQPAAVAPPTTAPRLVAAGADGQVGVFTLASNGLISISQRYNPFPGFTGEVTTAVADVNGDGVLDVIAATGAGGGPRVVVIDGATGSTIRNFFAYEANFRGGVTVAAADLDRDGLADIVVGAGTGGGPRVRVFSGVQPTSGGIPTVLADFFALEPNFRGGIRVATGDLGQISSVTGDPVATPDGVPDVIVAAGDGGGPRVKVIDGATLVPAAGTSAPSRVNTLTDFFAFEQGLRNGVYVAAADFNGDGLAEIAAGAGPGGGPRVTVYDGASLINFPTSPQKIRDFFAGDDTSRSGVRVTLKNIDNDQFPDIVTGEGPGQPPRIRTYTANTQDANGDPVLRDSQIPFGSNSFGGVWVG